MTHQAGATGWVPGLGGPLRLASPTPSSLTTEAEATALICLRPSAVSINLDSAAAAMY